MTKLSVMCPFRPGTRVDHGHRRDHPMPLLKRPIGKHCKYYTIEKQVGAHPAAEPRGGGAQD